jgi:hypothetical protein
MDRIIRKMTETELHPNNMNRDDEWTLPQKGWVVIFFENKYL